MSEDAKIAMTTWVKLLLAPVLVSLVVGAGSSYLTAEQAIAVQQEKIGSQSGAIEKLEDSSEMVIRLEERLVSHGETLERIERNLVGIWDQELLARLLYVSYSRAKSELVLL